MTGTRNEPMKTPEMKPPRWAQLSMPGRDAPMMALIMRSYMCMKYIEWGKLL